MNLHFISGLPRSGSTLLSAILNQNPKFRAGITSPVAMLCTTIQSKMATNTEFSAFFSDARRKALLHGIVKTYYDGVSGDGVVFDTNRTWTGKLAMLDSLYPNARVICCVRDIGWIFDSIERMLSRNPLQLSRIFGYTPGASIYSRAEAMMNSDTGLVGQAWATLREAWFGEYARKIVLLPYDHLVEHPARLISRLYTILAEPAFPHDFEHVTYDEREFDMQLGMPGLHRVSGRVEPKPRPPCIPPDLMAKYSDASFWRRPELNVRGVEIL